MKQVKSYIQKKQKEFESHPFFLQLEKNPPFEMFKMFIPKVAFWVFTFQDVLRINANSISDPYLHKIARHHCIEDKAHDLWYLSDLEQLWGEKTFDIRWLFSEEHQVTRDNANRIMAEALWIDDEILRIVLLLALEGTGHILFKKVSEYVSRQGWEGKLKYFDKNHLEVEESHAVFENEMERDLFEINLHPEQRNAACRLVYHCFEACWNILIQWFDNEPSWETSNRRKLQNWRDWKSEQPKYSWLPESEESWKNRDKWGMSWEDEMRQEWQARKAWERANWERNNCQSPAPWQIRAECWSRPNDRSFSNWASRCQGMSPWQGPDYWYPKGWHQTNCQDKEAFYSRENGAPKESWVEFETDIAEKKAHKPFCTRKAENAE